MANLRDNFSPDQMNELRRGFVAIYGNEYPENPTRDFVNSVDMSLGHIIYTLGLEPVAVNFDHILDFIKNANDQKRMMETCRTCTMPLSKFYKFKYCDDCLVELLREANILTGAVHPSAVDTPDKYVQCEYCMETNVPSFRRTLTCIDCVVEALVRIGILARKTETKMTVLKICPKEEAILVPRHQKTPCSVKFCDICRMIAIPEIQRQNVCHDCIWKKMLEKKIVVEEERNYYS